MRRHERRHQQVYHRQARYRLGRLLYDQLYAQALYEQLDRIVPEALAALGGLFAGAGGRAARRTRRGLTVERAAALQFDQRLAYVAVVAIQQRHGLFIGEVGLLAQVFYMLYIVGCHNALLPSCVV